MPKQGHRLHNLRLPLIVAVLFCGLTLLIYVFSPHPAVARTDIQQRQLTLDVNETIPLNCRYGVGMRYPNSKPWITTLGAGWYLGFTVNKASLEAGDNAEYVPVVRLKQDRDGDIYLPTYTVQPPLSMAVGGLGSVVLANPGRLWLVGNEPDVANDAQDNMYPAVYAQAYHEVYHFIKGIDPSAYVAMGGLSMMTPGRLQYLDIVWDTYLDEFGEPMPVDAWNMHLYILSEIRPWDGGPSDGKVALGTDPALAKRAPWGPAESECPKEDVYCRAEHDDVDIFNEQIVNMRTWMKAHGQQDKPLILSEFSQLYPFVDYDDPENPTQCFLMDEFGNCFTAARVSTFMTNTLSHLETAKDMDLGYPQDDYRLVQQWNWFSLFTELESSGGSSNLLAPDYADFTDGDAAALTQVGQTYQQQIAAQATSINLVADNAAMVVGHALPPAQTANVLLSVGFYNDGTSTIEAPFTVTFYSDAALTQIIGSVDIDPAMDKPLYGCTWGRVTHEAEMLWEDLSPGMYQYWVKVDDNNDINDETDEADNVVTGSVRIFTNANFIPVINH